MLRRPEGGAVVGREAGAGGQRHIGRVEVHGIAQVRVAGHGGVVRDQEVHALQRRGGREQRRRVHDLWLCVLAEGDIELTALVHAVQAVEAGFIQEEQPRRALQRAERGGSQGPHLVIIIRVGGVALVLGQLVDQAVGIIADHRIGLDQLDVSVGEHRVSEAPLAGEGEEDRAAPDEGFIVSVHPGGQPRQDLREQLGLSAGPFQEGGGGSGGWVLCGERHRGGRYGDPPGP